MPFFTLPLKGRAIAYGGLRTPGRAGAQSPSLSCLTGRVQSGPACFFWGRGLQTKIQSICNGKCDGKYNARPCDSERKAAGAGTMANNGKNNAQNNGNSRKSGRVLTSDCERSRSSDVVAWGRWRPNESGPMKKARRGGRATDRTKPGLGFQRSPILRANASR